MCRVVVAASRRTRTTLIFLGCENNPKLYPAYINTLCGATIASTKGQSSAQARTRRSRGKCTYPVLCPSLRLALVVCVCVCDTGARVRALQNLY